MRRLGIAPPAAGQEKEERGNDEDLHLAATLTAAAAIDQRDDIAARNSPTAGSEVPGWSRVAGTVGRAKSLSYIAAVPAYS
jgi:hypothetical protein